MNIDNNNIISGIKIERIDVSGLSREQAKEKINSLGIKELNNIGIIDVYDLPEETSVTVRFTFSAFERTLTMDEVQKNIEAITEALKEFNIKARF